MCIHLLVGSTRINAHVFASHLHAFSAQLNKDSGAELRRAVSSGAPRRPRAAAMVVATLPLRPRVAMQHSRRTVCGCVRIEGLIFYIVLWGWKARVKSWSSLLCCGGWRG